LAKPSLFPVLSVKNPERPAETVPGPGFAPQATEFLLKEVDPALRAALPSHLSAQMDPNRSHLGVGPERCLAIRSNGQQLWMMI